MIARIVDGAESDPQFDPEKTLKGYTAKQIEEIRKDGIFTGYHQAGQEHRANFRRQMIASVFSAGALALAAGLSIGYFMRPARVSAPEAAPKITKTQTQAQAQAARPAIATLTPRGCFGVAAGFIPAPAADFSTYTLRRQIDDREALKSTPNDTAPAAKAPAAPAPAQWLLLDAKWPHKPAFGGYRTAISVPGNFPRL